MYSNTVFADIINSKKNSADYIFQLYGRLIAWKANKQLIIITLNIKTELLAFTNTRKKMIVWKHFLDIIKFNLEKKSNLYYNNLQIV